MITIDKRVTTLEESVRLLIEGLTETNRVLVETTNRFAEELLDFKEENRIGFKKLRESQEKTERLFNTQWGKLVEALVNNQVVTLLRERGIIVHQTSQRVHGMTLDNQNYEFDIIAENGDTLVVVEVKTTLRVDEVRDFLHKLNNFKNWLPRYSNMKVYGAVAFLHQASDASAFAAKSGLFTILATGPSAEITNPQEFKPQEF